jgi:hypothetical protein
LASPFPQAKNWWCLTQAESEARRKRADDAAEEADDIAICDAREAERPWVAVGAIRPCSPQASRTKP